MRLITDSDIEGLRIPPSQCVEWVREALLHKDKADLPTKTWQHFPGDVYINTMPCVVMSLGRYGVKVVSRHPKYNPSLQSKMLLVDMANGECLACLDANWITAMRTGAIEALAGQLLVNDFNSAAIGFVGLGNMARATFECLQSQFETRHEVWLLKHKQQHIDFARNFADVSNVTFHFTSSRQELVDKTDILYSCVTVMNEQFLSPDCYPAGYTIVPVHMRGFQECDRFFDKIVCDDRSHVKDFKYYSEFKELIELSEILRGASCGRTNRHERILCYNIGVGLLDLWFASKIYDLLMK